MPKPAPRRRPRRSFGSITRLPSKRYRARYVGPDGALHNAPDTFSARIDAEAWLASVERSISRGDWEAPTPRTQTVSAARTLREYALSDVAGRTLTPRTRELYERQLDRLILPTLGDLPLDKVGSDQVRAWYNDLGTGQPTQRAHVYALLRSIFTHAVEDGRVAVNPCHIRSATSRRRARSIEPATAADLKAIEALDSRYALPVLIAGWCGLRSGEVRALRVCDVDLADGWLKVRQGVTRIRGAVIVGRPKTEASVRDVAIPPHLIPMLTAWRKSLATRKPEAYFFPGRNVASPMSEKALRYAFGQAKASINRPNMTFHDLRHTAATLAAQNGATTAELMRRLGHTTSSMAMRYQHGSAQRDKQLAAALSRLGASDRPAP